MEMWARILQKMRSTSVGMNEDPPRLVVRPHQRLGGTGQPGAANGA
jgi:hypothetical protein